jgi:hypothetical protein
MNAHSSSKLADRVNAAAEAALTAQDYVCPIDILVGIGWVGEGAVKRWRRGQVEHLEQVIQTKQSRISEALELFRSWATEKGLAPSEMQYVAQTPQRQTLRFCASSDATIERLYRTHWVSPELSTAKRKRLEGKANRPPELVVISPLNEAWKCYRCGGTGDLLLMEDPGPACLECTGLGDLVFVASGDALRTRRVKAKSARHAVVVRFSRSRRRYERRGLLVEPQVLADVERALEDERRR